MRDREDDLVDVGRHGAEVDLDLLVVALAGAGEVVAGCSTEPSGLFRLLKKTKWSSERTLPLGVEHERAEASRSKSAPVVVRGVPAEADDDRGQAGRLLGERDVAALGEADTHCFLLAENEDCTNVLSHSQL